jgi:predicted Zn-dependent peptidase
MAETFDTFQLDNGMTVLGCPMEAVESVAFGFMLPAGAARLPEGCCGAGAVIADWIFRGAGEKSSRELSNALEGLGLHRSSSVGSAFSAFGAALEAGNLGAALALYADVLCQPHLAPDQFDLARQLAVDDLKGLDDEPRGKTMLCLREQFYPSPWGRSAMGRLDELQSLTAEHTGQIVGDYFDFSQSIFTVAGKYDFAAVCQQIEALWGTQSSRDIPPVCKGEPGGSYLHIPNEGAQVHIGLMTKTAKPMAPDYYEARVAVSILSGGMSSRLFTEVREKRGLCYAIGAHYHGFKAAAGIMCYAGTMPDKAQETVDVIIDEFRGLDRDITEDELARAKIGLKSSLIMQSESSSSRCSGLGGDYHLLRRIRSLDEIKACIDEVSVDSVVAFLRRRPFAAFTAVTMGPNPVTIKQ